MADDTPLSDFSFPASPGDYFPPIMGDPGEEEAPSSATPTMGREYVAVSRSLTSQSIPNDTLTAIAFDAVDSDAGGSGHHADLAADSEHVVLGGGLWYIVATVSWAAGVTGYRRHSIRFADPNSVIVATDVRSATPTLAPQANLGIIMQIPLVGDPFNVSRDVGISVRHTQGAALNVDRADLFALRLGNY